MPHIEQFLKPCLELLQDCPISREPAPITVLCELEKALFVPGVRSHDMQRLIKDGLTAQEIKR